MDQTPPTHNFKNKDEHYVFRNYSEKKNICTCSGYAEHSRPCHTHTQTRHRRAMLTCSGETLRRPEVVGGSIQVCLDLIHLHFKSIKWQILFCLSLVLFEISFHSLKSCYLELSGIFVPNRSNLCSEVPMSDHFCV